jgi:hypothetical protein
LSPEEKQNNLIEEYKTLRQEISVLYTRKNSYVIYTVIATATIFGFAIEYPSPYIFLLPVIVIVPLSYKALGLDGSILHIGTYISIVIESKLKGLNWETYQQKRRERKEVNKKTLRRLSNYLLFDLLGGSCIIFSIGYSLIIDTSIHNFISDPLSELGEFLTKNAVVVILWFFILLYLITWTLKMRDCYSDKNQRNHRNKINDVINQMKMEQKSFQE